MRSTAVAATVVALRLLNAFAIRTFFQPDEYFQAWEPALHDVTGEGFVSWEWQAVIRSSLMPRLFGGLIRIANALQVDWLILGKVFMALVAASADLNTAKLTGKLLGPQYSQVALILSLGSAWNWYCSTRPFSNTIEMALVVWSLCYWPLTSAISPAGRRRFSWLGFAAANVAAQISIALRPSNGLLWFLLGIRLILSVSKPIALKVIMLAGSIAVATQGVIFLADINYFGGNKFPFCEFLRYNFGARVSEIYGVMPWHYYLVQAVPLLLIGWLPLFLIGITQLGPRSIVFQIVASHIVAFSLIAHKEVRFLYYLLPLLHAAASVPALHFPKSILALGVAVNLGVAGYLGQVHQRGVVDVIDYIRHSPDITDVSFLMPCHSTPWRAHLQRSDLNVQFLTCDPPWDWNPEQDGDIYVDEADQFYANPAEFLNQHQNFETEYVVVFEALLPVITLRNYSESTRFFNSHFHEDSRRRGDVIILHKND